MRTLTRHVHRSRQRFPHPDLDITGKVPDPWRGPMSRWVLMHMAEEYARHNGHVDLLRERIDGRVGQ